MLALLACCGCRTYYLTGGDEGDAAPLPDATSPVDGTGPPDVGAGCRAPRVALAPAFCDDFERSSEALSAGWQAATSSSALTIEPSDEQHGRSLTLRRPSDGKMVASLSTTLAPGWNELQLAFELRLDAPFGPGSGQQTPPGVQIAELRASDTEVVYLQIVDRSLRLAERAMDGSNAFTSAVELPLGRFAPIDVRIVERNGRSTSTLAIDSVQTGSLNLRRSFAGTTSFRFGSTFAIEGDDTVVRFDNLFVGRN
jgi:hypothetical protein